MSISLFSVCSIYIYYFKYLLNIIINYNNNGFFYKFSGDDFAPYTTCTCVFDRMTVNNKHNKIHRGKW